MSASACVSLALRSSANTSDVVPARVSVASGVVASSVSTTGTTLTPRVGAGNDTVCVAAVVNTDARGFTLTPVVVLIVVDRVGSFSSADIRSVRLLIVVWICLAISSI